MIKKRGRKKKAALVFDLSGLQEQLNKSHALLSSHYSSKYDALIAEQTRIIDELKSRLSDRERVDSYYSGEFQNIRAMIGSLRNDLPNGINWRSNMLIFLTQLGLYSPPSAKVSSIK